MNNTTWTHLCGNKITQIPVSNLCPNCGISSAVESLRFAGHTPSTEPVKKNSWLSRLIFKKKFTANRKYKPYEFQDDYNDRHG